MCVKWNTLCHWYLFIIKWRILNTWCIWLNCARTVQLCRTLLCSFNSNQNGPSFIHGSEFFKAWVTWCIHVRWRTLRMPTACVMILDAATTSTAPFVYYVHYEDFEDSKTSHALEKEPVLLHLDKNKFLFARGHEHDLKALLRNEDTKTRRSFLWIIFIKTLWTTLFGSIATHAILGRCSHNVRDLKFDQIWSLITYEL